jgi:hypothetical protein
VHWADVLLIAISTNQPSWGLLAAWSNTLLPGGPASLLRDLTRPLAVTGQDHSRETYEWPDCQSSAPASPCGSADPDPFGHGFGLD